MPPPPPGPASAAGSATTTASVRLRLAICVLDAPRAPSIDVSSARRLVSSRAAIASVTAPATSRVRIEPRILVLATSSAAPIDISWPGRPVLIVAPWKLPELFRLLTLVARPLPKAPRLVPESNRRSGWASTVAEDRPMADRSSAAWLMTSGPATVKLPAC